MVDSIYRLVNSLGHPDLTLATAWAHSSAQLHSLTALKNIR